MKENYGSWVEDRAARKALESPVPVSPLETGLEPIMEMVKRSQTLTLPVPPAPVGLPQSSVEPVNIMDYRQAVQKPMTGWGTIEEVTTSVKKAA